MHSKKSKTKNAPNNYFKEVERVVNCFTVSISDNLQNAASAQYASPLLDSMPGVVCVIDLYTKGYVYISKNAKDTVGYDVNEFYEGGLFRTLQLFPQSHMRIMSEHIIPRIFELFTRYAAQSMASEIEASYPTIMFHKDGTSRWYLHTMRILTVDQNNNPRLLLKVFSDIDSIKKDQLIDFSILHKRKDGSIEVVHSQTYQTDAEKHLLTNREKEILRLLKQGKTSKEIGCQLFITEQTVQNHRKNMLKKYDAKNAVELLEMAGGEIV